MVELLHKDGHKMPNPWTFHGLAIWIIGLGLIGWCVAIGIGYAGKALGF